MLERNQNNMPPDFEPPVPAWAADWAGGPQILTTGVFGVQGAATPVWRAWVEEYLLGAEGGPERTERAQFTDMNGVSHTVVIGYWRDSGYRKWWSNSGASTWWLDSAREREDAGYFREVFEVPTHRLETLHSTPNAHGIATLANDLEGPVEEHAYPGAMRDRIPDSGRKSLSGIAEVGSALTQMLAGSESASNVGTWVRPPANLCIIRSGQDWTHCEETEKQFYLEELQPSLRAGMRYLSSHPEESRCLSMRLMTMTDNTGNAIPQTFGLGYALDIYAFEEWAKSHPTHLRIFDQFMQHAGRFGEQMQLRLWHEVSVIENGGSEMQYIGCHADTGLLRYANG